MININILLDLIYPKRCPLCGQVQPYQGQSVCADCFKKLKRVERPHCMKCGKTLDGEEAEYCGDCMAVPKSFVRGFPVFFYEEPLKAALYDFKYKNQREYAAFFAQCIAMYCGEELRALRADGLVPVPVHPHRRKKRGYNQAELLAVQLSKRLGIPVYKDYLVRCVDTNPQKELNDKARVKNLKKAFQLGRNTLELKRVLLVDDIYTSGATIETCTRVLLEAGVREVYYTSVAIGKGYLGNDVLSESYMKEMECKK